MAFLRYCLFGVFGSQYSDIHAPFSLIVMKFPSYFAGSCQLSY